MKIDTLGDALPREIERCLELLAAYDALPQGAFAAANLRQDIRDAHKAMMEGDIVAMLRAHETLKSAN
ncbi:MAG: hypothetical protein O7D91_21515 [Planctomycetota bacterium]|nr:hypothetical protein [Planctomycetota bacterium]